jgi:hypothetical protein
MLAHLAYRLVRTALGPIAIRALQKQRFVDRVQDKGHRRLQQAVFDRRNPEQPDPSCAVPFGNLHRRTGGAW